MICDRCGEDRIRAKMCLLAFPRAGWPPVRFARVCPGCRRKLRGSTLYRAFFLLSCLALVAAIAAGGAGIVCLIQWIIRQSST